MNPPVTTLVARINVLSRGVMEGGKDGTVWLVDNASTVMINASPGLRARMERVRVAKKGEYVLTPILSLWWLGETCR